MPDFNNPYSAPLADEGPLQMRDDAGDLVDASPGLRFVHLIVDYIAFLRASSPSKPSSSSALRLARPLAQNARRAPTLGSRRVRIALAEGQHAVEPASARGTPT